MNRRKLAQLLVVASSLSLLNCAGVNFGSASGSTGSAIQSSTGDGGTGGSVTGTGTGGGTDNSSGGSVTGSGTGGGTSGTGGGTGGTGGGTGGTGGGGGGGTSLVYPKAYYTAPDCVRDLSNISKPTPCEITFHLTKAMDYDTDFNWRTNDTAWSTEIPPTGYVVGKPNYHYIPTGGSVHIPAGQTAFKVIVQNISPDPTKLIIYFKMSSCQYNAKAYPGDCFEMFP